MTTPLVSVIIPVYNGQVFLSDTLTSALAQTEKDLEILVIDDGSTDDTPHIALSFAAADSRIRYIPGEKNLGVANARNKGIELAKGRYIAFLDGDDLWLPEKIEKQLAYMTKENLDICYTAYSFIGEQGEAFGNPYQVPSHVKMSRFLVENVIGCSTAIFRKDALRGIRMRRQYAHEDYVFWAELLQSGCRAGGINEVLVHYRVHRGGRSDDKKQAAQNRWRIYREFLRFSLPKSTLLFIVYACNGIKKHYLK